MKIFKELFYKFSCKTLYLFFKVIFRLSVEGRENIPEKGNFILVARHKSYWDVPLLAAALGSQHRIHFVARKTLIRENWFIGLFVKWFAITIDRENFRGSDFKQILKALKEGKNLGIFPEGSTAQAGKVHRGVILFSEKSGKKLLPVNITSQGPYPPDYPLGFPKKMIIEIGYPFGVGDLETELEGEYDQSSKYEKLGKMLMVRVDKPRKE